MTTTGVKACPRCAGCVFVTLYEELLCINCGWNGGGKPPPNEGQERRYDCNGTRAAAIRADVAAQTRADLIGEKRRPNTGEQYKAYRQRVNQRHRTKMLAEQGEAYREKQRGAVRRSRAKKLAPEGDSEKVSAI